MTDAVVDRFLRYVAIDTQSCEANASSPSSAGQLQLARLIKSELESMGMDGVEVDEYGYLYAKLPANTRKKLPKIGFVAHLDTSPDEKGANIHPQIVTDPESGEQIIKTDGKTLLGADDKAGVAEIITAVEYFIQHPDVKHGTVCIALTPDEEIGRGTDHFDLKKFGADFAYTIDGGEEGEIEIENFNAAKVHIAVKGKPCHPGYAKDKMLNASLIAAKIAEIICSEKIPECSEGREGFFHITKIEGNVGSATLECLIRDFDKEQFEEKKRFVKFIATSINEQFGKGTVRVTVTDQYKNMFEVISQYPDIVDLAKQAMLKAGVTPKLTPIRGGTDGVKLCFMGLPCPNLYAGGINFHSVNEYIPVKSLRNATETIKGIVAVNC